MSIISYNHSEFIFVFGSNLAGRHGAGAARTAERFFDAIGGVGEGLQGRSYAIPTKTESLHTRSLTEIRGSVDTFLGLARSEPDTRFMVTRIGCGLAGYSDADVSPLFAEVPDNVWIPKRWKSLNGDSSFHLAVTSFPKFNDHELLSLRLDKWLAHKTDVPVTLVTDGSDTGADALVEAYASKRGYNVVRWPPDWKVFAKHGGYLRTRVMLWHSDASAIFTRGDDKESDLVRKACWQDGLPWRQVVCTAAETTG